ncbi:hypothetical protein MJO29_004064 [Puccinia striiformis f. sp. tritici]|nr:hypothetical protein MJO29_004064 [Puccinia striiformis f. sp. tritici]
MRYLNQTSARYKARIGHLEEMMFHLLTNKDHDLVPSKYSAPLDGSFRYSKEKGLVPLLSKTAATALSTDWQNLNRGRTIPPIQTDRHPQSPSASSNLGLSFPNFTVRSHFSSRLSSSQWPAFQGIKNDLTKTETKKPNNIIADLRTSVSDPQSTRSVILTVSSPELNKLGRSTFKPQQPQHPRSLADRSSPLPSIGSLSPGTPPTGSTLSPPAFVSSLTNLTVIRDPPIADLSSPFQSHSSEPISASPTATIYDRFTDVAAGKEVTLSRLDGPPSVTLLVPYQEQPTPDCTPVSTIIVSPNLVSEFYPDEPSPPTRQLKTDPGSSSPTQIVPLGTDSLGDLDVVCTQAFSDLTSPETHALSATTPTPQPGDFNVATDPKLTTFKEPHDPRYRPLEDSELLLRSGHKNKPPPATSGELDYLASISAVNVVDDVLAGAVTNATTIGRYTGIDPASLAAMWDIPEDDSDEEVTNSSETPETYNLAATGSISVVNSTEAPVSQQPATQYDRLLHEAELADYLEYLRECDSTVQSDRPPQVLQ